MEFRKKTGHSSSGSWARDSVAQYDIETSNKALDLALQNSVPHFCEVLVELATRFVEDRHHKRLSRTGRKLLVGGFFPGHS